MAVTFCRNQWISWTISKKWSTSFMLSEVFISQDFWWWITIWLSYKKNFSCKRDFSSRVGSFSDLRPPLWLSSIVLRHAILGRIPLLEGSAGPRDLRQHTTLTRHTSMSNGIRTSKPSKPDVVNSRLRPRGPWGRGEPLAQCVAQLWN